LAQIAIFAKSKVYVGVFLFSTVRDQKWSDRFIESIIIDYCEHK